MDPPVTFLTRLCLDAVLHDPPPPRQPSLQARLADPATVWTARPTAPGSASRPPPARPSGTTRASPPSPCAGCSCATRPGAATPKPCSAPTPTGNRPPSSPPTCSAGRWRPRFRRSAPTWAWRPSARGRWPPSPAPPRSCWAFSAGSSWSPTAGAGCIPSTPRRAAWYAKTVPTFADVLAEIRHDLWTQALPFSLSPRPPPTSKLCPSHLPHRSWPPSATRPDTRPIHSSLVPTLYKVQLSPRHCRTA